MNKSKTIIISIIFYIVGIGIMLGMFKLWDFLFDPGIWRTIFMIITTLGVIKYLWQHTNWTINQFKKK
jgi:hypothetical protein